MLSSDAIKHQGQSCHWANTHTLVVGDVCQSHTVSTVASALVDFGAAPPSSSMVLSKWGIKEKAGASHFTHCILVQCASETAV